MLKKVFYKQGWNLLWLTILLYIVYTLAQAPEVMTGSFIFSTSLWLILSIIIPIAHQLLVLLVWRLELHDQFFTRRWGDKAFKIYSGIFFLLLISRAVSILGLSIANRESIELGLPSRVGLTAVMLPFVVWVFYSVVRYFGITRAAGADHFYSEYRNLPMVTQGIFKYVNNAMYTYGLLILWLPGILLASPAGLLAAAFHHLYIWVHFFTTEKPDMEIIYR